MVSPAPTRRLQFCSRWAVHLVDVPERAVPGEQHRAVPQVQVGPDPRRLRRGLDDRDALARFELFPQVPDGFELHRPHPTSRA